MRPLIHPSIDDITIEGILHALADPVRAAIYAELAAKYNVVFYPFFLDGVALDDSLMQGDGIHPNAKGVAKIVASMLPKVDELLARVKPND